MMMVGLECEEVRVAMPRACSECRRRRNLTFNTFQPCMYTSSSLIHVHVA